MRAFFYEIIIINLNLYIDTCKVNEEMIVGIKLEKYM